MKKVIPLTYLHHDDQEISQDMRGKVCGIMCAAMILKTVDKDFGSVQELIQQGVESKAYLPGIGWNHQGLGDLLGSYRLQAKRQEFRDLLGGSEWKLSEGYQEDLKGYIDQGGVIIVSVDRGFSTNTDSTHLVVLHGYVTGERDEITHWIISDPSSQEHDQEEIEAGYFEKYFRGLGVVIHL